MSPDPGLTLAGLLILAEKLVAQERARLEDDASEMAQRAMPVRRARAYTTVRREHWDSIYAAVVGYLDTDLPITQYRNLAGRAVVEHFPEAFYAGYAESSGAETVAEDDDQYLTDRINEEIGHVDALFEKLKDVRKAGGYDADALARKHADAYTSTLDNLHDEGKVRGKTNIMLTFDGDDGEESCTECQRYKGQRHRARWWLARDLIRRNGNDAFSCGRWPTCKHHYYTDDGNLYAE